MQGWVNPISSKQKLQRCTSWAAKGLNRLTSENVLEMVAFLFLHIKRQRKSQWLRDICLLHPHGIEICNLFKYTYKNSRKRNSCCKIWSSVSTHSPLYWLSYCIFKWLKDLRLCLRASFFSYWTWVLTNWKLREKQVVSTQGKMSSFSSICSFKKISHGVSLFIFSSGIWGLCLPNGSKLCTKW